MASRRVSPQEAKQLIDDEGYVYVDVRSAEEFKAGRPAASYNVPLAHAGGGGMTPNPDFVSVMEKQFPKDAKLVIGCLAGGRSARAVGMLEAAGYTNLVDQRAGFDGAKDASGQVAEPGWSRVGLPVENGEDAQRGYEALRAK